MTAGFWLGALALSLLALAFLAVPLWRERRRSGSMPLTGAIAAVAIVPAAFVLYLIVTTFDPGAAQSLASDDQIALVEQLAARLEQDPEDVEGWKLLGRSWRALGEYELSRRAFEQAWNRTEVPDDALKLGYAEAMLFSDPATAQGLAGDLIEQVLASAPASQAALWLGGIVAVERNELGNAAERFTALLATNPPPDIAQIVRQQLTAITGSDPGIAAPDSGVSGPVIDIEVSVSEEIALDRFGPAARLFLLARSSDMPAPIAVKPIALSALPGRFSLSDADAMMAGRSLSQYETVTVVARISASGMATEAPGDVYAEATVRPVAGETISLVIDQVVPEG